MWSRSYLTTVIFLQGEGRIGEVIFNLSSLDAETTHGFFITTSSLRNTENLNAKIFSVIKDFPIVLLKWKLWSLLNYYTPTLIFFIKFTGSFNIYLQKVIIVVSIQSYYCLRSFMINKNFVVVCINPIL